MSRGHCAHAWSVYLALPAPVETPALSGARTVLVADDHPLVRDGVRAFLSVPPGSFEVLTAATLDEATGVLAARAVDLLMLDLDMPGMHGIDSLRALREGFPELRIAVLSGTDDRAVMAQAMAVGLNGYVPKSVGPEEFGYAIESLLADRIYLPPSIASSKALRPPEPAAGPPPPTPPSGLSPRQEEVLRRLAGGSSNKEIARELGMAEGTVKIHLAAIFRRLDVHNRTEAALKARSLGLPGP